MYVAYLEQKYEGCDYSIGCGVELITLVAQDFDNAVEELRQIVTGVPIVKKNSEVVFDEGYYDESVLAKVTLFEISQKTSLPVEQWYADAKDLAKHLSAKHQEGIERLEYERLKAKFTKIG